MLESLLAVCKQYHILKDDILTYVHFTGIPGILPVVSSRPTTGRPSIHDEPDLHSASLPPSPFAISFPCPIPSYIT